MQIRAELPKLRLHKVVKDAWPGVFELSDRNELEMNEDLWCGPNCVGVGGYLNANVGLCKLQYL